MREGGREGGKEGGRDGGKLLGPLGTAILLEENVFPG
jgi:hypothetical protein